MAAIANIAVYDGAATPVLHTLTPISVTRDKGRVEALWREAIVGVPVYGQPYIKASIERLKSGVWKTDARFVVPVMESVGSQNAAGYTAAPKVAYENTVLVTGFFHERSDVAGRRLVKQLACNALNNVTTSVAAATTGPIPDLMDTLVAPT